MFLDFVLSRFRGEPELLNESDINIEDDEDWTTEEAIEIIPNPHLSPAQQHIVIVGYGMHDSPLTISCRRALIKYLLKRLDICVDTKKLSSAPKKYQLTLANPKNIKRWLL
nr:hypothetical protein [Vibrio splendidus]